MVHFLENIHVEMKLTEPPPPATTTEASAAQIAEALTTSIASMVGLIPREPVVITLPTAPAISTDQLASAVRLGIEEGVEAVMEKMNTGNRVTPAEEDVSEDTLMTYTEETSSDVADSDPRDTTSSAEVQRTAGGLLHRKGFGAGCQTQGGVMYDVAESAAHRAALESDSDSRADRVKSPRPSMQKLAPSTLKAITARQKSYSLSSSSTLSDSSATESINKQEDDGDRKITSSIVAHRGEGGRKVRYIKAATIVSRRAGCQYTLAAQRLVHTKIPSSSGSSTSSSRTGAGTRYTRHADADNDDEESTRSENLGTFDSDCAPTVYNDIVKTETLSVTSLSSSGDENMGRRVANALSLARRI